MGTAGLGILLLLGICIAIALAVAWIALPFIVLALKGVMNDILLEQRRTNALLSERIRRQPAAATLPAKG